MGLVNPRGDYSHFQGFPLAIVYVMNIIEITYLLSACWVFIFILWMYLKYRMRHLPSLEELILEQDKLCEEMLILNNEFMAILNKQKTELDNEMEGLLRDYDEPDKTFH